MKQRFTEFFQKNGFYVLAAVCVIALAAVIAVVSTDTKESTDQIAENAAGFSDDQTEVESTDTQAADEANSNQVSGTDITQDQALDYTEGYNADEIQDIITQIEESEATSQNQSSESTPVDNTTDSGTVNDSANEVAANATANASYDGSAKMTWPVQGEILIDYSMESTTYFKTLDQYRCNEGIMIAAQTNTPVNCAYDGIIESIYGDEEYGTCIIVNMGNDYKAIYGQLKDLTVSEGQSVTAGQQLGYVSEPTKYFTEEGSHLFFEITQDDLPMNPHNYLE